MATMVPDSQAVLADLATFFRIGVREYDEMVAAGILTTEDRVELLDGYLVKKMAQNEPHSSTVQRLTIDLVRVLPAGWQPRIQLPIQLSESVPEPDAAIVRGDRRTFSLRKPEPADFGIVVEVSDTTLRVDRDYKSTLYARDGLPCYWIVNLIDRRIEVFTEPVPAEGLYRTRVDYPCGQSVPLVLDGVEVGRLAVDEWMP